MNVNVPSSSDFSQITSPINLTARSTGRRSHSEYKHIVQVRNMDTFILSTYSLHEWFFYILSCHRRGQGTNQDFFESCISPVKIKGIWELKEKKAQEAQLDHPIEQEFKTSSVDIHVHKDALETIEVSFCIYCGWMLSFRACLWVVNQLAAATTLEIGTFQSRLCVRNFLGASYAEWGTKARHKHTVDCTHTSF